MPSNNPIDVQSMPMEDGTTGGAIYLRGNLIARTKTKSKARTLGRYLNKFLARLPQTTEVSLEGLQSGISSYLTEAALGKGIDRKPVRVIG